MGERWWKMHEEKKETSIRGRRMCMLVRMHMLNERREIDKIA